MEVFRRGERVHAQLVFKPCHDDGEAERIQSRFQQYRVVGQAGQDLVLFARHLFELGTDNGLDAHGQSLGIVAKI